MNARALFIMAIPAAVAVSGGVLAALWKPSHQVRSLIQHFAAGVILAALAVELLPDIGKEHATKQVVLGAFAAGSLFMYALKLWTDRLEGHGSGAAQGAAVGLLVATFVDVATDGFIIGAGFAAGGETGTVLALGLSVELLSLGLAADVVFRLRRDAGLKRPGRSTMPAPEGQSHHDALGRLPSPHGV